MTLINRKQGFVPFVQNLRGHCGKNFNHEVHKGRNTKNTEQLTIYFNMSWVAIAKNPEFAEHVAKHRRQIFHYQSRDASSPR